MEKESQNPPNIFHTSNGKDAGNGESETKRHGVIAIFKDTLHVWAENTTFHCIKYVFDGQTFAIRRIFWLTVIIGICYVLVNGYISQVERYFEYKTITKDTIKFENEMEFPSVTICSYCSVQNSSITDENERKVYDRLLNISSLEDMENIINEFGEDTLKNFSYYEVIQRWAVSPDRLFYYCTWQTVPINCTRYMKPRAVDGTRCYTFNYKEDGPFKAVTVGRKSALSVALFLDLENCYGKEDFATGVQVMIHDVDEEPNRGLGTSLSPGFLHNIALAKETKIMLPSPVKAVGDAECMNNLDPEFKNPLTLFQTYSMHACEVECISFVFNKTCGCTVLLTDIDGLKPCNVLQLIECAYKGSDDFWSHYNEYISRCGCLMPCQHTLFPSKVSSAYIPSSGFRLQSTEGLISEQQASDKDFIRENMMVVEVYFESKVARVSEQTLEFTKGDLAASIGGYIGLAIGASVMTFLELFEMFFTALVRYCLTLGRTR